MEDGSGSVERLQFILNIQSSEDVFGIADRQMGRVRVVRGLAFLAGSNDVRIFCLVVFCQTVGSGFGRSCLEVVEIVVHFLILNESLSHVVEYFDRKFLRFLFRQVFSEPVDLFLR